MDTQYPFNVLNQLRDLTEKCYGGFIRELSSLPTGSDPKSWYEQLEKTKLAQIGTIERIKRGLTPQASSSRSMSGDLDELGDHFFTISHHAKSLLNGLFSTEDEMTETHRGLLTSFNELQKAISEFSELHAPVILQGPVRIAATGANRQKGAHVYVYASLLPNPA